MSILEILNTYIEGNFTSGNQMLGKDLIDAISLDPASKVHRLLVEFKEKGLIFDVVSPPVSLEEAELLLKSASSESLRYVYALYILKFQNPIAAPFVDKVLERIDA